MLVPVHSSALTHRRADTLRLLSSVAVPTDDDCARHDTTRHDTCTRSAYPNWTSSVKVPFPVQCAAKLAHLMETKEGGCFLGDVQVHDSLRKGYFYL
jgi:hypothetical protein